ncbi:MAG: ROK family protein [Magnetococcales bacterium]|nr:ROK family protein [Magnetococcales bacterium]NGZ06493.1 ROK family protein [Magnetococcales bacterium]
MRIGIDLGGTKIEIVVLDGSGRIVYRERALTPGGDYAATLATIIQLVHQAEHTLEIHTPLPVGIGIPGAIAPQTGLIQNANSVCLIGRDLAADLATALERPIRLANDADCFALSEATDGAGAGVPTLFGVILGTGVGGGIVVGGQLLSGPNAIAGEWGHNPLPWPEPDEQPGVACYCGRSGCIETFLSGPALSRQYGELYGTALPPATIVQRAANGERIADDLLTRYEQRLARALAVVVNILDPHVIVLGGGLSNLTRLYHSVPQLWKPYIFAHAPVTRLVPARFGDSSGVRGAAWLWPQC